MNMLAQINSSVKTMSSREISTLTNKQHSHVIRDAKVVIDQILDDPNLDDPHFQIIQDGRGYISEIHMDRNLTLCLVSGYSVSLRMAIIKRWDELENQNAVQLPQTFAEALQLAADQARQLELAAPKVQYFDRVADTKNLLNASQVGKKVGMSAVKLNQYLADMGVYDRRIAGRTFAQWFIDKGYGEVKQTEQGYPQSKFTNKGEQWVVEQLVSEGVVQ